MISIKNKSVQVECLTLPEMATTKFGQKFIPEEMIWSISDGLQAFTFDFTKLNLSQRAIRGAKQALIWYLQNKAMGSSHNTFIRLKKLLSSINRSVEEIGGADILNFRASIPKKDAYLVGSLGAFFKKWHDLNGVGISHSVPEIYREMRIKGNAKGEAILTMDPFVGQLTE